MRPKRKKTDTVARVKHASLARLDLRGMTHEGVINATIQEVKTTTDHMERCLVFLREAQRRFSNRGKPDRTICGYRGWRDFVERGLGRSLRTVQRQMLEASEPIKAEERREKDRQRYIIEDPNADSLGKPYRSTRSVIQAVTYPYVQRAIEQPEGEAVTLIPFLTVEQQPEGAVIEPVVAIEPTKVQRVHLCVKENFLPDGETLRGSQILAIMTNEAFETEAVEAAGEIAERHGAKLFDRRAYPVLME